MSADASGVVIITGGGGFLGQCLATEILKTKTLNYEGASNTPVKRIILADVFFAPELQPAIEANKEMVMQRQGDISDKTYVDSLYEEAKEFKYVSVFHLGAVMSGDGERDFDLCINVNLHGFINIIEGARKIGESSGNPPTLVLTSAGATIGSGAPTDYISKNDTISDATRATPHTTYGATKACCELLLSDYARRGMVRSRGLRLPTIVVRAGKPNAATTSCYSGVVREPLSGVDAVLPIARDVKHAVTGMRHAIFGLLTLHNASNAVIEETLGYDRTVFLPSIALSLGDLQDALYKVVTEDSQSKLGNIIYEVDERVSSIVGSFPTKIDGSRAKKLGIPAAPDAETLVRHYAEDFASAIAQGIQIVPKGAASTPPQITSEDRKVAVITGAGSGIGLAIARRLSRGGWTVVLAGRRLEKLEEAAKGIDGDSLCVPTDVSVESDVENLFETTKKAFGRIDLLFNNAGINCSAASIENVAPADFRRVMGTNITGAFMCARAAINIMKTNGGGRIINNGSISAHVPRPGSAPYTASKHAMLGLTKCIALDGRVNNVACGQIDFGNVVSEMSLATNKAGSGAMQANGTLLEEASMTLEDAAETFWTMANLPLSANVLNMTVMATKMPFVGRG